MAPFDYPTSTAYCDAPTYQVRLYGLGYAIVQVWLCVTTTTTATTPANIGLPVCARLRALVTRDDRPKNWRWFHCFRNTLDMGGVEIKPPARIAPARLNIGPNAAERRRWKRRRYLQQLMQGGAR